MIITDCWRVSMAGPQGGCMVWRAPRWSDNKLSWRFSRWWHVQTSRLCCWHCTKQHHRSDMRWICQVSGISSLVLMTYHVNRIIKVYIMFHKQHNTEWGPTAVTHQIPYDIHVFITHKCGKEDKGYEGRKVYLLCILICCQHLISFEVLHCCLHSCSTDLLILAL
jgi:hypothetical protein